MCLALSESLAVVLYCFCYRTRTCAETLRVVFVVRAVSRLYGARASCLGFPPSRQHMCVCSTCRCLALTFPRTRCRTPSPTSYKICAVAWLHAPCNILQNMRHAARREPPSNPWQHTHTRILRATRSTYISGVQCLRTCNEPRCVETRPPWGAHRIIPNLTS